ncbi:hypothetical protein ElyMa_000002400 [Elysia marginata]|uniref:SMB domain-containing protein n=1 Tax=Elysia marginata TaxID=1093978 RepID=A0AAV4E9W7_9GAST|nr:hypothetical protein ElyMa_000002400 [Elysia marginata]
MFKAKSLLLVAVAFHLLSGVAGQNQVQSENQDGLVSMPQASRENTEQNLKVVNDSKEKGISTDNNKAAISLYSKLPETFSVHSKTAPAKNNTSKETNLTPSDGTVNFTTMLMKLIDYTEEQNYYLKSAQVIDIDPYKITASSSPYMKAMISEQGFCDRPDILERISCNGRCGQAPDSWATPGQCGCDHDCFLYGDCCEDLNPVCQSEFMEAVETFYYGIEEIPSLECSYDSVAIMLLTKKADVFVTDKLIEIYCDLGLFKLTALENIAAALFGGKCLYKSRDAATSMRSCGTPDVVICNPDELPTFFNVYPISLHCYDHHFTRILYRRFYTGIFGMMLYPNVGRCKMARIPSNDNGGSAQASHVPQDAKTLYTSTLDTLKMRASVDSNLTVLDFYHITWGTLRCTGGALYTNLTCMMYDCPRTELIDTLHQLCYRPDSLYIQFSAYMNNLNHDNAVMKLNVSDGEEISGETVFKLNQTGREVLIAPNVRMHLCLCLKVHSVIKTLGWWQVLLDTSAFLEGLCKIKLHGYQTEIKENELDNLIAKVEDFLNETNGGKQDGDKGEIGKYGTETGAAFIDNTNGNGVGINDFLVMDGTVEGLTQFSQLILYIWKNDTRRCPRAKHMFIMWCFSKQASTQNFQTCLSWRTDDGRNIKKPGLVPLNRPTEQAACPHVSSTWEICLAALLLVKVLNYLI